LNSGDRIPGNRVLRKEVFLAPGNDVQEDLA
jgi:hypothetical protein